MIFAVVGPALLTLGTPWRTRVTAPPSGSGQRPRRPSARAAIRLTAFIAVTVAWRLPGTLNALARSPALAAAEMVILLAVGTGIWLELTSPRPSCGPPPALCFPPVVYITGMKRMLPFCSWGTCGGRPRSWTCGFRGDSRLCTSLRIVASAMRCHCAGLLRSASSGLALRRSAAARTEGGRRVSRASAVPQQG